jgi:hypothetical protein
MRFPEPLMGNIEAEARAKGISVPELCRRIIVERNQAVERERVTEQVTPIPTPLTSFDPSGSPRIETPAPSPVGLSQKAEVAIVAATATIELAKIRAEFPELSPPTENMIRAMQGLAKVAEKHPEEFGKIVAEKIVKGEMSEREVAEFLEYLGV